MTPERFLAAPLLAFFFVSYATTSFASEASDLLEQATAAAASGEPAKAVALASQAIEKDTSLAEAFYLRGREHFRLGKVKQSVADFDKYVKLRPDKESRQWERGISMYYAGQYQRGADQFKLYQTYHNNDVENSTWRYLCMSKVDGVAKARTTMLPIKNDRRVPMMQIYDLYRGKLEPEDVLAACEADKPEKDVLAGRLFYARLYLGLYFDVNGKSDLAKKYILLAADKHKDTQRVNRYMYDVARVHAQLIRNPN